MDAEAGLRAGGTTDSVHPTSSRSFSGGMRLARVGREGGFLPVGNRGGPHHCCGRWTFPQLRVMLAAWTLCVEAPRCRPGIGGQNGWRREAGGAVQPKSPFLKTRAGAAWTWLEMDRLKEAMNLSFRSARGGECRVVASPARSVEENCGSRKSACGKLDRVM